VTITEIESVKDLSRIMGERIDRIAEKGTTDLEYRDRVDKMEEFVSQVKENSLLNTELRNLVSTEARAV